MLAFSAGDPWFSACGSNGFWGKNGFPYENSSLTVTGLENKVLRRLTVGNKHGDVLTNTSVFVRVI